MKQLSLLLIMMFSLLVNSELVNSESAHTETATKSPVLTNYGPSYKVANSDFELPKDFVYKAVFDLVKTSENKSQHSGWIESVARFINMHAKNGVKTENMKLAVVFHGPATKDTLSDTAYKKRFGVNNPNSQLIKELSKQGVEFYLCGQSAGFKSIKKEELSKEVKLGLSAMTMFVLLQKQGYQLIP